jgi:hypothetical protein
MSTGICLETLAVCPNCPATFPDLGPGRYRCECGTLIDWPEEQQCQRPATHVVRYPSGYADAMCGAHARLTEATTPDVEAEPLDYGLDGARA